MFTISFTLSFLLVVAQSFSFINYYQTHKTSSVQSKCLTALADNARISGSPPWVTVSSIKEDIIEGTSEILLKLEQAIATHKYNVGVVVISSIYEQNQYQDVVNELREKIPNLQTLIGCTAGCVIGSSMPWQEPAEVESKASIAVTLLNANQVSTFRYDDDELIGIINNPTTSTTTAGDVTNKFSFILGCESAKPQFANFVEQLTKQGTMGSIVGAVASSVTALHLPKIFLAQQQQSLDTQQSLSFEKYNSGVVGVTLSFHSSSNSEAASAAATGDAGVSVQTIVARSSLPVGPVYRITERRGNEIRSMVAEGDVAAVAEVPLVLLDQVLTLLGTEESDALKRELLVSVGSFSSTLAKLVDYSCQRPTDFNPTEGSLVMPFLSAAATHVQFSVRDSSAARRDLLSSSLRLKRYLEASRVTAGHNILGVLVLGSVERGTKVFRYSSWESAQVWRQLQSSGNLSATVPAFGLFAGAAVFASPDKSASLMESDAVYTVISTGPPPLPATAGLSDWDAPLAVIMGAEDVGDILTPLEAEIYSDVNDLVVVSKKDSLSSHAVRVSTMEFTVPEKQPQPGNTLESLYWERDKDLDRQRERFPLNRALLQAKLAEKKYPSRNFPSFVKQLKEKSGSNGKKPSYIVTVHRSTLNAGRLSEEVQTASLVQSIQSVASGSGVTLAAIGVHVDSLTNKGQFEDLSVLRTESTLPVFCDDFVLFAYQLFRARECGADVVRLHASATAPADMTYLIKIARTLQMTCLVTCASKPQLLAVLREVPQLEAVCVTSRNVRLWKLDANKADRVLNDVEVQQALAQHPNAASLVVCQEGFANHLVSLALNDRVDAVLFSEELLRSSASNRSSGNSNDSSSSTLIDSDQFTSNLRLWLS